MTVIRKEVRIEAPADRVWALVGPFDGAADWMPPVAKTETDGDGPGAVRTVTLEDGGRVKERLEALDEEAMTYDYSMVDTGALPVANYRSRVSVDRDGRTSSRLRWMSRFDPSGAPEEEVAGTVEGFVESGLACVRSKLGG